MTACCRLHRQAFTNPPFVEREKRYTTALSSGLLVRFVACKMMPIRYTVDALTHSQRLDQFLAGQPDLNSRSQIAGWTRDGRVRVNGMPAKPALRLQPGDQVEVDPPPAPPATLIPEDLTFAVVFEDEHLIVVNKPQGLSVHPGPGHPSGTLLNGLLHRGVQLSGIGAPLRPGIVHRIDMDTSGLVVVAKTDETHRSLAKQFSNHTVDREYLALVWGEIGKEEGTIRSSLARSPANRKKFASVSRGGKPAVTHWRRLIGNGLVSLLALHLETGRTHQIRVHMSESGHPLLGDGVYGRSRSRGLGPALSRAIAALPGQALHAARLGFSHPASSKRVSFESAPPAAFEEVRKLVAGG